MAFLTPDTAPSSTLGVVVFIPDDPNCMATLLGLLDMLAHAKNWEQFGLATPEEISYAWGEANDDTAAEAFDSE